MEQLSDMKTTSTSMGAEALFDEIPRFAVLEILGSKLLPNIAQPPQVAVDVLYKEFWNLV